MKFLWIVLSSFLLTAGAATTVNNNNRRMTVHEKARYSDNLLAKLNVGYYNTPGIGIGIDIGIHSYGQQEVNKHDIDHEIVFTIQQRNLDYIESRLYEVSSPSSPDYGKHMTKQEIDELTSNRIGTNALIDWLHEYPDISINYVSTSGLYVKAMARVSLWETVLDTTFHPMIQIADCENKPILDASNNNNHVVKLAFRAKQYSLPEDLVEHVSGILNVLEAPFMMDYFQCAKTRLLTTSASSTATATAAYDEVTKKENIDTSSSTTANPTTTTKVIDSKNRELTTIPISDAFDQVPVDQLPIFWNPQALSDYYDIFTNDGMGLGSQLFLTLNNQNVSAYDLEIFQALYNLPIQPIAQNIGGHLMSTPCPQSVCSEGNLDVQYLMGLAQNIPTTYYYEVNLTNAFYNFVMYLEESTNPPLINSISYGGDEDGESRSELEAFNTEAMKLGLRGVTLIFATGDWGVTGYYNSLAACGYMVFFPATCPYVLAVGGTQGQTEVVGQGNKGSIFTTGGGFSNYYPMPSYQKDQVKSYFTKTTPYMEPGVPSQTYNSSNRGYPDVAAQGSYYQVVYQGRVYLFVTGTSASTPVTAAMLSLVNSARLKHGQSPLGFVQPLLYESSSLSFLKDITIGNNSCLAATSTYTAALCCALQGYTAQPGWDPTTGLGSINFRAFYNAVVDTSSSNNSGMSAGQSAALGISIVVIIIVMGGALIFICKEPVSHLLNNQRKQQAGNDKERQESQIGMNTFRV